MTTGKTITLTIRTFISKVTSLLFSILSRLVIVFLPRSRSLLISWLQSPSAVILELKKIKSVTVLIVSSTIVSLSKQSAETKRTKVSGNMLLLLLSRFSHVRLCDPIDSSPIPGILQARKLEGVAISFSNAWKWKLKGKLLSHVRLFATPRTAAHQVPPSMGFPRQEYWSGLPLPSPPCFWPETKLWWR